MTERRDLKRRVRERQAATGEAYTTALRNVLAQRSSPRATVPYIELADLTELGKTFAMTCRVSMFPSLAEDIDPRELLASLCLLLGKTERDRGLDLFRAVVLRGENPKLSLRPQIDASLRFADRVRAGIGGISELGHILAIHVEGKRGKRMVLFLLSLTPDFVHIIREPTLMIAAPDDVVAAAGLVSELTMLRTPGGGKDP